MEIMLRNTSSQDVTACMRAYYTELIDQATGESWRAALHAGRECNVLDANKSGRVCGVSVDYLYGFGQIILQRCRREALVVFRQPVPYDKVLLLTGQRPRGAGLRPESMPKLRTV